MFFVKCVFILIQLLFVFHFIFPFFLFIIKKARNIGNINYQYNDLEADYAIIITAYEQTNLISAVVDSISKLNYTNYLVYIVADNCDISKLSFEDPRIIILRPEITLASNIRSHFYAINRFKRSHERLTIIDSDNLLHPEYLNELNKVFILGFEAVQGVREAKNLNTTYACLDAAGDIYYRYIDRKLLFDAGSSASLSGSGMAFTTSLYVECLGHLEMGGAGFDKILQYQILRKNKRIAFADHAIVYDEKTAKTDQLVKQRARWINTWFKFFSYGIKLGGIGILNFNRNQILFSVMLVRPPLFMLILSAFILTVVNVFTMPIFLIIWFMAFLGFVFIFRKSLKFFKTDPLIYRSLKSVPKFAYFQVLALLKANKANELSVATKHGNDEYDNSK